MKTDGAEAFPYLWSERPDINRFGSLMPSTGNIRVGLCWKGSPNHRRDEYRSMRFEDLSPLLDIPDVDFYSLQKGDAESGLLNLTEYCHDIADTAAAIANLDLVITVDTAMLHLAGAIGKPVWGLIHRPGEWRWGADTEIKTPWYSSALLSRQQAQKDWSGVVQNLAVWLDNYFPPSADVVRPAQQAGLLTVTRSCKYGPMMWLRNDHYIGRSLDMYGEYSESEADLLRKVLQRGDVAVEAGANVGALTVAIGAIVGQRGTVYAYEPQPAYYDCLVANTAMAVQIHALRAALGRKQGTATLRKVETEKTHAPGWATCGEEFTSTVRTIDSLRLPECALIKIDVDGQEHEILLGAEASIDRCRPIIYVEHDKPTDYPEMLTWLHSKGYRLYQHAAPLFNPQNHRGNGVNVFGSIVSLMILAVPQERKRLHPLDWGLGRLPVA